MYLGLVPILISYIANCILVYYVWGGAKIGKESVVYAKSHISNLCHNHSGCIEIGRKCMIGRKAKGYHAGMPFYTTLLVDGNNGRIHIGDNCRINGAYIHAKDIITIGDNCVIASGVQIIDSNGHKVHSLNRTIGRDEPKPINIGNNVWVGLNAIILKGTSIGNNSVVAAGSVVKGSFPSNTLIQGNPAQVARTIET